MKRLVLVCALLAALAAATAPASSARPYIRALVGTWAGGLHQQGGEVGTVRFTISRYGSSTPTGRVAYAGLGCSGKWTFLGLDWTGEAFRFREVITRGASNSCKGVGIVRLRVLGHGKLAYRWTDGRLISAATVARRR